MKEMKELEINGNVFYVKGEKGEKGEQGIQGEKGEDGKDGINGKDGTFVHSYNEVTKTLSFNSSLTNINLDLNSY